MLDVPYREFARDPEVYVEINKGTLPLRPVEAVAVERGLSDDVWDLLLMCWEKQPDSRPTTGDVLYALENLVLQNCAITFGTS